MEDQEDKEVRVHAVIGYSGKVKGFPRNYKRTGLELLWKKVFKVKDYRKAVFPTIPKAEKNA